MKALRILLPLLLILAVIGLLVYQGFVEKSLETDNLTKAVIIILGAVGTMFKKPRQRPVANKKALYQKAYPEFIQEPFAEEPKMESRFYDAVHDYNRNKPSAAIAKLEKLRGECQRTADVRAVTVFTALCLDDIGRYEDALAKYDAARKIWDCSTLASNMGLCAYRLGNFQQAQDYYEEAIQLDKTNAYAYNNLATLYFAAGDYESALGAAEDAISCNEKLPQALSTAAICAKLIRATPPTTAGLWPQATTGTRSSGSSKNWTQTFKSIRTRKSVRIFRKAHLTNYAKHAMLFLQS